MYLYGDCFTVLYMYCIDNNINPTFSYMLTPMHRDAAICVTLLYVLLDRPIYSFGYFYWVFDIWCTRDPCGRPGGKFHISTSLIVRSCTILLNCTSYVTF